MIQKTHVYLFILIFISQCSMALGMEVKKAPKKRRHTYGSLEEVIRSSEEEAERQADVIMDIQNRIVDRLFHLIYPNLETDEPLLSEVDIVNYKGRILELLVVHVERCQNTLLYPPHLINIYVKFDAVIYGYSKKVSAALSHEAMIKTLLITADIIIEEENEIGSIYFEFLKLSLGSLDLKDKVKSDARIMDWQDFYKHYCHLMDKFKKSLKLVSLSSKPYQLLELAEKQQLLQKYNETLKVIKERRSSIDELKTKRSHSFSSARRNSLSFTIREEEKSLAGLTTKDEINYSQHKDDRLHKRTVKQIYLLLRDHPNTSWILTLLQETAKVLNEFPEMIILGNLTDRNKDIACDKDEQTYASSAP